VISDFYRQRAENHINVLVNDGGSYRKGKVVPAKVPEKICMIFNHIWMGGEFYASLSGISLPFNDFLLQKVLFSAVH